MHAKYCTEQVYWREVFGSNEDAWNGYILSSSPILSANLSLRKTTATTASTVETYLLHVGNSRVSITAHKPHPFVSASVGACKKCQENGCAAAAIKNHVMKQNMCLHVHSC